MSSRVRVRERRDDDLPVLVDLLAEQQPASSYPVRWPLPMPVEDFLRRPTEREAWVAEHDGTVVGHVSVTRVDDVLGPLFAAGTSAPDDDHEMVSVLFTGTAARGLGAGGALLDTAVARIRARGLVPVLDVVPVHDVALELYRRRGWVEVGRWRFPWLADDQPDVLLMALPPYPASSPASTDTAAS